MSNSIQSTFWKKANENFNSRYAPDVEQLDVQPFMAHDIFTLNIFDEEVKKYIISKSTKRLSKEQLNKLVILLKYFLRTGISIYHFANNEFTKKFVYSDNSTINKYLDILQEVDLISYSKFKNEKNPKLQGYSINPTKTLNFAISLKEANSFTRGRKKDEKIVENIVSVLDEDFDRNENNFYCNEQEDEEIISSFLSNNPNDEKNILKSKIKEKVKQIIDYENKVKNESIDEIFSNAVLFPKYKELKELYKNYEELGGYKDDFALLETTRINQALIHYS